ncbi:hypothetical protein P152DRAFT_200639 [Eremomyces bilateralis CBS 781.70]|uniref:Hyphal anastamosis-8 protein n=1 Tax=Eremomyces bilateralis CBS 781.70 TaxID=1392243 RepID=A0A6G1GCX0_9PEZI|nr:uncharacterized protein P152DRAFT_200639 [Eremomyces bilateralis CBS 781.70]KAF1815884.1 hypothetical protein P152DRAFT_200639 [Eremomyces bilateralis CBS 781.70]
MSRMAADNKRIPTVTITSQRSRSNSLNSTAPSLKSPRTARFAEATSVNSPIEPSEKAQNPFADPPTNHYLPQPQPADIGFGYMNKKVAAHTSVEMEETDPRYLAPTTPRSPLKSALKSPGAPPRTARENPLSPTFQEEQILEKQDELTEKEQEKDLRIKFRVRLAKILLRGVNFSCSLIVVAMLVAVFSIFRSTRNIASRNGLPPWAPNTPLWPQITILVIASISLFLAVVVLWANCRHGHRRAEKVAVYYTTFAVFFFVFSIVMWGVGAAILQSSKNGQGGSDMWGWACKDNRRKELFQDDINYGLVCRLMDWALVCAIIEIVVELFIILIYGFVFYRFWSKRRLRKSMAHRDKARSDLYLAQLRSQSAPNTPGFPLSPRDGGWRAPADHNKEAAMEEGTAQDGVQYAVASPRQFAEPKPFALQAPPSKNTPKVKQDGFSPVSPIGNSPSPPPPPGSPGIAERHNDHVAAAPGEQTYDAVPIPGSYAAPLSPGMPPQQPQQQPGLDFGFKR